VSLLPDVLLRPESYAHPAHDIQLVETHISWVVLAGDYAYKLKKPVDLGFLDFSTLARRRHFCTEEVRLNRRLAPQLYLDVVALRRADGHVRFSEVGEILEYAVRMRRFEQRAQLDRQLEQGRLDEEDMDEIAARIAHFHAQADRVPSDQPYGSPDVVMRPVRENFSQLEDSLTTAASAASAAKLRRWTEDQFERLRPVLSARRQEGHIRECHGDLHLRNMARIDGQIVAFDGIEFDPALRWIDVISDSAFLHMDLVSRGRPELGWRFLNQWLELTGDYAGLRVLTWYLVYRHMVRTKVDGIRLLQADVGNAERAHLEDRILRHLSHAEAAIAPGAPRLVLMWGLSGSGKSWLSARLADHLPALRVRSDVERKRLFASRRQSGSDAFGDGLYAADANDATYERLLDLAGIVLEPGFTVIVDASFLEARRRIAFRALAERLGIPWLIVCCEAPPECLRQRVVKRATQGHDPSDAGIEVLEQQLRLARPPTDEESAHRLRVRTDEDIDVAEVVNRIRTAMQT